MTNLIAFGFMVLMMMGQPNYTEKTIKQAEAKCEAHGGMVSVWADGAAVCKDSEEIK